MISLKRMQWGVLRRGILLIVLLGLLIPVLLQCNRTEPSLKRPPVPPRILPPVAWGGTLPSGSFRAQIPDRITILHSGEIPAPGVGMAGYLKSLQQADIQRGRGDLGAHFYMDPGGVIYQSRRAEILGRVDEEKDFNFNGHILIVLIGDYNQLPLAEPLMEQFVALIGWLTQNYNIPLENVKGLKHYLDTDSPGWIFSAWFEGPDYDKRIKEYLKIPSPTPTPTAVPGVVEPEPTPFS